MFPLAPIFLALATVAQEAPSPPPLSRTTFLPCFEFARKPVREWMAQFEHSWGTDLDALWCIYWSNDRSSEVVEFLKRWQSSTRIRPSERNGYALPRDAAREIDSILVDWGVPHESLAPEWSKEEVGGLTGVDSLGGVPREPDRALFETPRGLYALPVVPLDGDEATLLDALERYDRVQQARAAIALVHRGVHVPHVLDVLVARVARERGHAERPTSGGGDDAPFFARSTSASQRFRTSALTHFVLQDLLLRTGSEGVRAVERFARHDPNSAERAIRLLGGTGSDAWLYFDGLRGVTTITELWASYAASRTTVRDAAWNRLLSWADVWPWWFGDLERVHSKHQPRLRGDLEPLVVSTQTSRVRAAIESGDVTSADIDVSSRVALELPSVRDAIAPIFRGLLARDDFVALAALQALCHLGAGDEMIRREYARRLDRWTDFTPLGLARIPCLETHDERTSTALGRVLDQCADALPLACRLQAAGLVDPSSNPLAKKLFEKLVRSRSYDALFAAGFSEVIATVEGDKDPERVAKLGISLRARLARGESTSTEMTELRSILSRPYTLDGATGPQDYWLRAFNVIDDMGFFDPWLVDWCFSILLDPSHYGSHAQFVYQLLAKRELDRREQAIVCQARNTWPDEDAQSAFFACFGHNAIERAARIRSWAQRYQLIEGLRDLLRISRPSEQDLSMLVACLERGYASERETALSIVAEHEFDTPEIRAAVVRACDDVDDRVRAQARTIRSRLKW